MAAMRAGAASKEYMRLGVRFKVDLMLFLPKLINQAARTDA